MNVLDENIVATQRELLRSWKIHLRRIGGEVGRAGMKDRSEIIPLLHTLRRPTFFTRDHDFYKPDLCHPGYCLVFLDVAFDEAAEFIRRLLQHAAFRTLSSVAWMECHKIQEGKEKDSPDCIRATLLYASRSISRSIFSA